LDVCGLLLRARSDRLVDLERRDVRVGILLVSVSSLGIGHGTTLGQLGWAGEAASTATGGEASSVFQP
jgi:hypothetical protein